jgi:hypothetical protein
MTSNERDTRLMQIFRDDMAVLACKGTDYAPANDVLRNLRRHGSVGVVVRLGDKYERLNQLLFHGKQANVANETIIDTIRDMRIYCALLQAMIEAGEDTAD